MPNFLKGSWPIKIGAILVLAAIEWIVAKLLDTFSSAVAKMPDIDKLSWGIVVFLLIVGVFLFFSPIIEKWIHGLGGDKNEVSPDPSKPKVSYIAHIDYIKKENILLKQKVAEMQKQIDNVNKPIKKELSRLMHDNVLWEDDGDYWGGGGIIVNGPLCPKDYAVLMMERYDKIEELKYDKLISLDDFHYRLYCPECKNKYMLGETSKEISNSLAEVRNRFAGLRKRSQIT